MSDPTNVRRLQDLAGGNRNNRALQLIGNYRGEASSVQVARNTAYVTYRSAGLQIFDVTKPGNVQRLSIFNGIFPPQSAEAVQVVENRAYVAIGGLEVLDVSNPASPQVLGASRWSGAFGVQVLGNFAYVAAGAYGLQVLDVSDPTNMQLVGGFDTVGSARQVQVIGNLAFIADGTSGLQAIRMSGGPGFAPGILAGPQDQEAPLGGAANLRVSAAGTEPLRYQWRKDGVDLEDGPQVSGSRTASMTINDLEAADFGSYSVVVRNQAGTVASAPATLRLDERFRVVFSKADLRPGQGRVVLRISGAPPGETVILSNSLDLINWVPWLTNVMSAGALEAQVPWTGAEPRRFFRAIRR